MSEEKQPCYKRIKEALSMRKMKQADLVEATGLGKSAISQYVSGKYEPKQTALYKIAKALNVSEAWLMGYDVPMKQEREKPSEAETIPEGMTRVKIFHRDGNTDYADFTPEQMKLIEAMMKSGYKK